MSSDEAAGTSSSFSSCSNSTTSSSNSYENMSTIENGDLSVFTFMIPNTRNIGGGGGGGRGDGANSIDLSPCSCSTFQGPCMSPHLSYPSRRISNGGFSMEPYAIDSPYYFCNNGRHKNSHVLIDNNYMRLLPRNGDSLLLRTMERGVLFPVVHWSSKYNENLTHQNQFGSSATYNQGVYKELKRVIPPDVWLHRDMNGSSISRKPTWLIIGYKSLEKTLDSSLEATWKEWTGVRHIYLNLRHDFEIQKISFFHRVHPRDNLDLFMYIVTMEIGNVHEKNTIWLLDFVQRMRMERMKGFLTVYSEVEQEISLIDDEYFKYFNQDMMNNKTKIKTTTITTTTTPPLSSPTSSINSISSPSNKSNTSSSSSNNSSRIISNGTNRTILNGGGEDLSIIDHTSEINGNLKLIEKLLEEMGQQPIGDYF